MLLWILAIPFLIGTAESLPETIPDNCVSSPMSLEDCLIYAKDHAPDYKKLEIQLKNQKLQIASAKARFQMDFSCNGNVAVNSNDTPFTNSVSVSKEFESGYSLRSDLTLTGYTDHPDETASFSISLSRKILGGGGSLETRMELDDSLVDLAIFLNDMQIQKRNIGLKIIRQYYRIIQLMESKGIQLRQLKMAKRNLEIALAREEPMDIANAQIQIPKMNLTITQIKQKIASELDLLKIYIGMPVEQELKLSQTLDFQYVDYDISADIAFMLANHEEIINRELELKKSQRHAEIFRRQLFPNLSVVLSHQSQSSGEHIQTLSLEMQWQPHQVPNLVRYQRQLNAIEIQKLDQQAFIQNKIQRIRQLASQIQETAESIRIQEQNIQLMERKVALYADKWENGETEIIEYIRSQNSLEESKVSLLDLQIRYIILIAEYANEVGR